MLRLTSDRQVRYAIELIDVLMRSHGFVPDENYIPSDQAGIFEQRGRRRARVVYIERPGGLPPAVGELVGGSQREERLEILQQRMEEMGVHQEGLQWYLDLRRYGGCQHAGFGLGFERFIMYVTGMQNIRDVIPFARTPKNLLF